MNVTILSHDINKNFQPQYMHRAIKYNMFDIYHISDTVTCETSMQLIGCFQEGDAGVVNPTNTPSSYSVSMSVGYDLHYIADQDGAVDETCTRAFINKITMKEQFGYIECMESKLDFETFLSNLMDAVKLTTDLPPILSLIADVAQNVSNEPTTIKNEENYKTLDITSGVYNMQKVVKSETFQFQSIPLSADNFFLESFSIECSKDASGFSMKLKARSLSLDVRIEKLTGNTAVINLGATCDA